MVNFNFFFGLFILLIDGNFIKNSSYFIYAIVILLLIIVLFMPPIKGAKVLVLF